MPGSIRRYLLEALEHLDVEVHTLAEVVDASDGSVIAMMDGQQRQFTAGSVVVAIGRVPNAGLADELEQAGFRVQVVGDAVEPRHMQAAVYEAAEAARIMWDSDSPGADSDKLLPCYRKAAVPRRFWCDIYLDARMPGSIRRYLLEALEHLVVEVHTGAEVVGASDGSVIAMVDGQQRQFAAGSVVVAIGRVPNAGLADELEQAGFRVQVVGDAVEPRHMQAAVYEGAEASGVVGGV